VRRHLDFALLIRTWRDRSARPRDDIRDCYSCAHSPPFPGHAGCAALVVGDEGDPVHDAIVTFCNASGANDNDGWPPPHNLLDCGAHAPDPALGVS